MSSQPTTPPVSPDEDWVLDAVLKEEVRCGPNEDADDTVKNRLREACGEVALKEVGGEWVYTNPGGFQVLEKIKDLESEQKKNKSRFTVLENEMARLRSEGDEQCFTKEGISIRRRFIATFRRDHLKVTDPENYAQIKLGNEAAHHGNALGDAHVFKVDNRMDFKTYARLYGFQFGQVLRYSDDGIDGGIFSVINSYATLLVQCNEGKVFSSGFEQAFRDFILVAEDSYPSTPLSNSSSKLTAAYWRFWDLHKLEKRAIRDTNS